MNDIEMLKQKFVETFSDDPIIWGKYLLVLIAFILTFVVRIKFNIDEKFSPSAKLDKKVKKAIDNKHIINATLIRSYVDREENTSSGKYEYEIDGKKYKYTARFNRRYPPTILHLYYENNPKKLFTDEEYHYYTISAIPLIFLNLSPFIVGAFMVWILGLVN